MLERNIERIRNMFEGYRELSILCLKMGKCFKFLMKLGNESLKMRTKTRRQSFYKI